MASKINYSFFIFFITFFIFSFTAESLLAQPEKTGVEIRETVVELQELIRQKQTEGVDVSQVLELDRQSRESMRQGRPQECLRLLKRAIALLKDGQIKRWKRNQSTPRISFFEVHMEPSNANDDTFDALTEFVNLADRYNVKLTLLFTPQWAEMILKDSKKLGLLDQWKQDGHGIGGHHHGPSTCPWDGYTNLDPNSQEFKNRQNKVPCPKPVRAKEKYLGNMDDYMELLSNLGQIKTVTMSDADVDWPNGAVYSGGGRRLERAISQPELKIFNGQKVYQITIAALLARRSVVTGLLITVDDLKNEYLSEKEGVFGVGAHAMDYKEAPNLYKQWFELLNEQDPKMSHAMTISQIIEASQN
ncbi:MAG TPA: hypothetical protein ENH41_03870 [Candidatus Omnitrophica bacterium]|nr:hypothetical protein [Candidatus Omnitrophota bacterium]